MAFLRGGLERAHERWRDPILTGLAALLAFSLFVVAPLHAVGAIDGRGVNGLVMLLAVGGMTVVSRSAVPLAAAAVALALVAVTIPLRGRGGYDGLDVCLEASAWLLVGLVMVWVVARAVFGPGRVTYHRVVGAVLLYLAVGLVFVALFTVAGVLDPGAFSGIAVSDRKSLSSDLVYFSFATLTTVGYGDIVPLHPIVRSLCSIESVFGQLYPATLLARMVSLEVAARR